MDGTVTTKAQTAVTFRRGMLPLKPDTPYEVIRLGGDTCDVKVLLADTEFLARVRIDDGQIIPAPEPEAYTRFKGLEGSHLFACKTAAYVGKVDRIEPPCVVIRQTPSARNEDERWVFVPTVSGVVSLARTPETVGEAEEAIALITKLRESVYPSAETAVDTRRAFEKGYAFYQDARRRLRRESQGMVFRGGKWETPAQASERATVADAIEGARALGNESEYDAATELLAEAVRDYPRASNWDEAAALLAEYRNLASRERMVRRGYVQRDGDWMPAEIVATMQEVEEAIACAHALEGEGNIASALNLLSAVLDQYRTAQNISEARACYVRLKDVQRSHLDTSGPLMGDGRAQEAEEGSALGPFGGADDGRAGADFRGLYWAASQAQVHEAERRAPLFETPELLVYEQPIGRLGATLTYRFVDTVLVRGTFIVMEDHVRNNAYLHDFDYVAAMLETKYGAATRNEWFWEPSSIYRDDPSHVGLAIATGDLVRAMAWETETTLIVAALEGENFECLVRIDYVSKQFGSRELMEEILNAAGEL